MKELIENVLNWADEKGLLRPENAPKQYAKIIEEFGETCSAILKGNHEEIKDGLGDLQVTVIIYANQIGKKIVYSDLDPEVSDVYEIIHELSEELSKNSLNAAMLSIMDICHNLGYTPEECLQSAWDVISKRTGNTIDGVFVKSDDLV